VTRRLSPFFVAGPFGIALLMVSIVKAPAPILVWNASASMTRGLYLVSPRAMPVIDESVVAWAPRRARTLAAARGYLPDTVPLVKRVAATEGDVVCADGPEITINGRIVAQRQAYDARNRLMPWWSGCQRLDENQLFLLIAERVDSFDGRYFGITDKADIVGRARLIWAW
jgi:conjugative transfer signal peptidase TraF